MVQAPQIQLLDLPDEVLITVLSFLNYDDLRRTVFVCQTFNGLSDPFLYNSVQVLSGRQAIALAHSLSANINRAGWIRDLLISTRFGEDEGLSVLPPFIAQMGNLQDIRLETPDCNLKDPEERIGWVNLQARYERIFGMSSALVPSRDARFLPNLRSCTIHFVDATSEIYSMTQYSMLFLHPNLRSLTISCASTDYPSRLLVPFQNDPSLTKFTRLEHLHLEECDIYSPSLAILLSFPRQLKSLKISEGVRYDTFAMRGSSRLHGNVSPGTFVDALAQHCSESLEFLSLSLGYQRTSSQSINHFNQCLNLTRFENIKYLEVDRSTARLVRTRPCDHLTWRRLPPNLETLRIFGISLAPRMPFRPIGPPKIPVEECFIQSKAKHGVPKLKNLIFSYDYYPDDKDILLRVSADDGSVQKISQIDIYQGYLVKECTQLQPICEKAGVQLQLEIVELPDGFIPPYLFPEKRPTCFILWQSASDGKLTNRR